ncbi:MAG: phytanoyl-CoA dioxygenase family protein [Alphaproteobacteria bacterium]|nr:phytanoyl-CoA dioxygenase family protein [Alphaproteobacteria bacterium]
MSNAAHRTSLEHLPASSAPEKITEILNRDGALIIDSMLTPGEMDSVAEELKPWMDQTPFGPDDFSGRHTRRTGALVARSPKCRQLVMNPLVLGAAAQLLGHATSFQLHLTQVIAIGPGEPAQPIHRDQWAFDFFPFPKGFDVQCNTIWAMTDFTEENGATRVIPGSNHFEDRMQFTEADTIPAEMRKGSVLLYNGSVYHGGGANRSAAPRAGINITYCLSWLRQEENQYLSVPLEIARTLPDDMLRLIGYQRGAYALGYVGDLLDPMEAVRSGASKLGLGEDLDAARARFQAGYETTGTG